MDFSRAPQLWIVSDGGLCQDIGYYGQFIANDTSIIWEGWGQLPGNNTQFDSLRSESSGFLHDLTVLQSTLQAHDSVVQSVILASDNKVLIDRVQNFQETQNRPSKAYVKPHMNIQCQIDRFLAKLIKCIPQIQVSNVLGHQDSKKKYRLIWLESLNV